MVACNNFLTLGQATLRQCNNAIRLMWHAYVQKLFSPWSENKVLKKYLTVLRQATICWPYTDVRLSQQLSRVSSSHFKIYKAFTFNLGHCQESQ